VIGFLLSSLRQFRSPEDCLLILSLHLASSSTINRITAPHILMDTTDSASPTQKVSKPREKKPCPYCNGLYANVRMHTATCKSKPADAAAPVADPAVSPQPNAPPAPPLKVAPAPSATKGTSPRRAPPAAAAPSASTSSSDPDAQVNTRLSNLKVAPQAKPSAPTTAAAQGHSTTVAVAIAAPKREPISHNVVVQPPPPGRPLASAIVTKPTGHSPSPKTVAPPLAAGSPQTAVMANVTPARDAKPPQGKPSSAAKVPAPRVSSSDSSSSSSSSSNSPPRGAMPQKFATAAASKVARAESSSSSSSSDSSSAVQKPVAVQGAGPRPSVNTVASGPTPKKVVPATVAPSTSSDSSSSDDEPPKPKPAAPSSAPAPKQAAAPAVASAPAPAAAQTQAPRRPSPKAVAKAPPVADGHNQPKPTIQTVPAPPPTPAAQPQPAHVPVPELTAVKKDPKSVAVQWELAPSWCTLLTCVGFPSPLAQAFGSALDAQAEVSRTPSSILHGFTEAFLSAQGIPAPYPVLLRVCVHDWVNNALKGGPAPNKNRKRRRAPNGDHNGAESSD
jgi:hypothetical protein